MLFYRVGVYGTFQAALGLMEVDNAQSVQKTSCKFLRQLRFFFQVDFARNKTHGAAEFYLTTRVGYFCFSGISKTLRRIVER